MSRSGILDLARRHQQSGQQRALFRRRQMDLTDPVVHPQRTKHSEMHVEPPSALKFSAMTSDSSISR